MHQPISQQGLLGDLLAPTMDTWSTFSNISQELTTLDTQPAFPIQPDDFLPLPSSSSFSNSSSFSQLMSSDFQSPYTDESSMYPSSVQLCFDTLVPINGWASSSYDQHMFPLMVRQEDNDGDENVVVDSVPTTTVFTMGLDEEKKSKSKKLVEGQPASKNLMAERRRRKRLNDRLSMLRSIVPKISKMDRTSILGDTIDYMKELLEKIQDLKEQLDAESMKMVRESNMNQSQVRNNPPKFDVERGNMGTRIQICCSTKPGLLLSTLDTLEALGLDMQQCVISCFNDFSFQASCSQAWENRSVMGCEEMKQILFRNAGYGGRCL